MGQARCRHIPTNGIATTALVPLFAPYCAGVELPRLERALSLLQSGGFSGARPLQGGEKRVYALTWSGGLAPLEPVSCYLAFPQQPAVHYNFAVAAHHLLAWLVAAQAQEGGQDLPHAFWRWLILGAAEADAP